MGVSSAAVSRWKTAYRKGGRKALSSKPHPGARPKLTAGKKRQIPALLAKGARNYGYSNDLWTLRRIAEVIEDRFGVEYHPSHVWKILRDMGWSAQKPERRAREPDEEAILRRRRQEWPRIKKARSEGKSIVIIDGTGLMLERPSFPNARGRYTALLRAGEPQ